jgi:hypothetical protein
MFIDQEQLLKHTNGGLDIILRYYPDANTTGKFKSRREEKTPSSSMKLMEDGNYIVTDWGDEQKNRNGIAVFMFEEGISDFREALKLIAAEFGFHPEQGQVLQVGPEYECQQAQPDDEIGDYYFETKDFTQKELQLIGPDVTARQCLKYALHSIEWHATVKEKDGELVRHVFRSTEHYPIFQFCYTDSNKVPWGKRLEPKAKDKKYRFRYYGTRPKDVVFGLQQARNAYQELNAVEEEEYESDDPEAQKEERKSKKLEAIIICSGDRDALATHAATGHQVVWYNSESKLLTTVEFKELQRLAYNVYYLGDIDETGLRQAHRQGMRHLDLFLIRLPKSLLTKKDHRGSPCKDVRDFLAYNHRHKLKELIRVALPYRLWDERLVFDKLKKRYSKKYEFNHLQTYNFLEASGFYRFRLPNTKAGYIYVRIQNNVVEEIDPVEIKAFVNNFLKERKLEPELRNAFFKSRTALGEQSLSNLALTELDFTDYTRHTQLLFFRNTVWEVSADGIKEQKPGEGDRFVWQEEIIDKDATALPPPFEVYMADDGDLDIKIHNKECLFFRYLIQTSRVHWAEEERLRKNGKRLSPKKVREQHLHLINKLFALGYLMHRYKDPSRPWAVYAMDNKLSDDGESHGGTGKSIAFKAIRYFMKSVTLEGRNPKLTENPHIYENVTHHTDYMLIDDANQYLKFDFFYSILTGEMNVNPKHGKQYEIPFEEVPKMAITSNFGLRNTDPSTERRLLYCVFSDYFHHNKDHEYERTWSPEDEFGKNLFQDFDQREWNLFFNTMASAMQLYLNHDKIDPPMENVTKRNLVVEMSQPFKDWAEQYFTKENYADTLVCRKVAIEDFLSKNHGSRRAFGTTNRFTKALKAFCKFHGYTLDPPVLRNQSGRVIRKYEEASEVYIYVQAFKKEVIDEDGNILRSKEDLLEGETDQDKPF